MRHVKRRWKVENTWKCSSCGVTNKGRDMKCLACGSPKEGHEKYDTSKNLTSPAVTNPSLLRLAQAGKNWECKYCQGSVRNLYGECRNCGGPKTEEAMKYGVHHIDSDGKEDPVVRPQLRETVVEAPREERVFTQDSGDYRTAPKSVVVEKPPVVYTGGGGDDEDPPNFRSWGPINWKPIIVALSVIAGLGIIIGLSVYLFMPHSEHVVVSDTSWTYYAHLQQRETHSGEGWDETVPVGAFNESCNTRQRGTEDCNPHDCNPHSEPYDCNPTDCNCSTSCEDDENGFSSCEESCDTCYDTCYETEYDTCYDSCPVYDDYCTYSYYTWPTIHTETLSGHDHNMAEPVLEPMTRSSSPQRVVREHAFLVRFRGEEESWNFTPDNSADYNRFTTGDHWLIEVNHAGGVFPQHVETTP